MRTDYGERKIEVYPPVVIRKHEGERSQAYWHESNNCRMSETTLVRGLKLAGEGLGCLKRKTRLPRFVVMKQRR